jgi:translocation and assembly module TamB
MKRVIAAGVVVLALVIFAAGVVFWYVSSGRLGDRIRAQAVAALDKATDGHAAIARFAFDWRTLTAEMGGVVIHGTEPAGAAPLFTADRITVRFRIASFLARKVDLLSVAVEHPQVHLIVSPDGSTNLPHPKSEAKSGVQQILDLAIASFDAGNGVFDTEVNGRSASQPWTVHGQNLRARLYYDANGPRYTGSVSVAPVRIATRNPGAIDVSANAEIALDRDRIRLSSADLRVGKSDLRVSDLTLQHFEAPVITAHYEVNASLADFVQAHGDVSGEVKATGDVRFVSPAEYSLTGVAHGAGIDARAFGVPWRNVRFSANVAAVPDRIALSDVRAEAAEGEIFGGGEVIALRDFKFRGRLARIDLRHSVEFALHQKLPYSATISGSFEAAGSLPGLRQGRFLASARLSAAPRDCGLRQQDGTGCIPVSGDVQGKYDGNTKTVDVYSSSIALPSSHIDAAGVVGRQLNVTLETRNPDDFVPIIGHSPYLAYAKGDITFAGTVSGALAEAIVAGRVTARNLNVNGETIDAFAGDVSAYRNLLSVRNGLLTQGTLKARLSGSIALIDWQPSEKSAVDVTAQLSGADAKTLLAMAGEKNIDFSGAGTVDAHVTGTPAEPRLNATLALTHGLIYRQPYDTLTARLEYPGSGAQLFEMTLISGPKRVVANGRFEHPPGAAPFTGTLTFHAQSNGIALNQIALVRARQPDLHGVAQFRGDGSARVTRNAKGDLEFELLSVNGDASASDIELAGRDLGDARLTASTTKDVMTVRFDSNAARASIHGNASVQLEGDYPMNATVTFSRAGLNALAVLVARPGQAEHLNIDGTAAGEMTLRGPARDWTKLTGTLLIPEFEIYPAAITSCGTDSACAEIRNYRLRNNEPVRLALANGVIAIEDARFIGPETDIAITGTLGFTERTGYNLRATGNVNLALGSAFSTDFVTSGSLRVNAAVRGALNAPDLSGRAEIRDAAVRYSAFASGLSSVNAALVFSGDRATIQNFTAESGGGKVDAGGFIALTGGLVTFRLQARASAVRLRLAEGASIVSDSTITFAGTLERSEASGTVTIHRVTINPRADLSSVFARTGQPVKAPTVQAGLLSRLNLDVQIETAADVALETSLAQRIQADANLRLRGTATNPALLGRVNITSGELMFFGNKYSLTQGSLSFLNPSRIDPVLNVDLETRARGVDVIITIAGPLTKPAVSYRSDPPLQFSDIVALLATGRSPFDSGLPTGTVGQQQAFAQLGASQLIGEAIANPSSGRLQRFFGVTKAKIDPQLSDVTGSPESRLTIEQQVSPDILFTYITDVSNTSTQLIRVEWAFNRHWSAIVTREENGYVGLDFQYRKRFR